MGDLGDLVRALVTGSAPLTLSRTWASRRCPIQRARTSVTVYSMRVTTAGSTASSSRWPRSSALVKAMDGTER